MLLYQMMFTQLSLRIHTLLLLSLIVLSACGDAATDAKEADQMQSDLVEDTQAVLEATGIDTTVEVPQVDTVTGTIEKVVDDGKDNTKEPCNDLIRKQIASQNASIDELKEMLAGETNAEAQAAMKEEIQVMEKDAKALGLRYDCE